MALGEDAVEHGARPWQISYNRPGDGYLWDSEVNAVRYLHVPFITDEEIHALRYSNEAREGVATAEADARPTFQILGATTTPPVEMRDESHGKSE